MLVTIDAIALPRNFWIICKIDTQLLYLYKLSLGGYAWVFSNGSNPLNNCKPPTPKNSGSTQERLDLFHYNMHKNSQWTMIIWFISTTWFHFLRFLNKEFVKCTLLNIEWFLVKKHFKETRQVKLRGEIPTTSIPIMSRQAYIWQTLRLGKKNRKKWQTF